jgi:hypothetical protein
MYVGRAKHIGGQRDENSWTTRSKGKDLRNKTMKPSSSKLPAATYFTRPIHFTKQFIDTHLRK